MADFGLIPSENDYQKRIGATNDGDENTEEKSSDKNRFKPLNFKIIAMLVIVILSFFTFKWYQNKFLYPDQTKSELLEIRNALYHYEESFDVYPKQLTELAKGRPLRETWFIDAWENPYRYEVDEIKQNFIVTSAGYDGVFDTDDDIQIE